MALPVSSPAPRAVRIQPPVETRRTEADGLLDNSERGWHYRGNLTDAELALWAASHNTLKAIKARAARHARQARTAPAPALAA